MSKETTIYDAFTGMSPWEKGELVNFLDDYGENAGGPASIREAMEYALKNKPSFGGFILVTRRLRKIVAAIIANRTGMDGYNPTNIFVYAGFHPDVRGDEQLIKHIMHEAIEYADGEIAMHVKPGHPALELYETLGFQAQYLELRLDKKRRTNVA